MARNCCTFGAIKCRVASCLLALCCLLIYSNIVQASDNKESKGVENARLAEKNRKGEIDVGYIYSVTEMNGRFHIIHVNKLLLDCNSCHGNAEFKKDYKSVDKHKVLSKRHKGRVDKAVCLGCHREGGMATPWYIASTEKKKTDEK